MFIGTKYCKSPEWDEIGAKLYLDWLMHGS